jgi:hypothetical protein
MQSQLTARVRSRARRVVALLFTLDLLDITCSWILFYHVMTRGVSSDVQHTTDYLWRKAHDAAQPHSHADAAQPAVVQDAFSSAAGRAYLSLGSSIHHLIGVWF